MNIKKIVLISFTFLFIFFGMGYNKAHASTLGVYGHAWSDDVGWISFNNCGSADPTSCSGPAYGVTIDSVTGDMTGNAWSDEVGWITFNNSTGCPIAGCTTKPKVDFTTGAITGFARVYPTPDYSNGGWDGWIALNATDVGKTGWGLKLNSDGTITGPNKAAWGDLNLGWIVPYLTTEPQKLTVSIQASPTSGAPSDNITPTLTWQIQNASLGTTCATSGYWDSMGPIPAHSYQQTETRALTAVGTYAYTITCDDAGYTPSATAKVVISDQNGTTQNGQCSTTDRNSCFGGQLSNKSGGTGPNDPYKWDCIGIGTPKGTDASAANGNGCSASYDGTGCIGNCPGNSSFSVTLTASPTSGKVSDGITPTLTWTVSPGAQSCTASDEWSGPKSKSGGQETETNALGLGTHKYTLICNDANGNPVSAQASVTINPDGGTGGGSGITINACSGANLPTHITSILPTDPAKADPVTEVPETYTITPESGYTIGSITVTKNGVIKVVQGTTNSDSSMSYTFDNSTSVGDYIICAKTKPKIKVIEL